MYTRDLEGAEVRGIVKVDKVPQGRQGRVPAGDGRVSETEQGGSGFVRQGVVLTRKGKKDIFYVSSSRSIEEARPFIPKMCSMRRPLPTVRDEELIDFRYMGGEGSLG